MEDAELTVAGDFDTGEVAVPVKAVSRQVMQTIKSADQGPQSTLRASPSITTTRGLKLSARTC